MNSNERYTNVKDGNVKVLRQTSISFVNAKFNFMIAHKLKHLISNNRDKHVIFKRNIAIH